MADAKLTNKELVDQLKALGITKGLTGKTKPQLTEMLAHVSEIPSDPKTATAAGAEPGAEPGVDMLSISFWRNTAAFKAMKAKETQTMYYTRMAAAEDVLYLVNLDSKPFGSECEKIIQELFKLEKRTSSQNDGVRLKKKIEIKSARYWAGENDCRWQHLEPEHDYEVVLFVLLDFHGFKIWAIRKSRLMGELREKRVITFQGKQGWWLKKSDALPFLTPIHSLAELDAFLLHHDDGAPAPPAGSSALAAASSGLSRE